MRILVIRGENLASIAGRFEIQLDQPPLAGAGLFAITGPTGAGKSTLLDAMCLALFDEMPRFDGRGGALIGRPDDDVKARLQSRDVRSILRRGAGQGFAEVEYIGRDGARYRARWTVHRAREKANGAFQTQGLTLVDVATGQLLAGGNKKTEALKKIEETLGLTYEQFRRSALLAQGDFAAFLRASEEQRSSLLEQMTGTALYSRLSVAAHDAFKEARDEVSQLERELGTVRVLAAEERAQLEARVEEILRQRKQAEETVTRLVEAQRWWTHRRELVRGEEEAVAGEQVARSALDAMAPLRSELGRVERAHRVKPLLDAARVAEDALARANAQRDALAAEVTTSRQRRDEAAAQRAAREEALRQATEVLEQRRPTLEAAAKLDAEVAEAERRLGEAAERAQEAKEALEKATAQAAEVEALIAAATARRGEVDAWMAANPALEPLAAQWPRWEREIRRYATALGEERGAEEARARAAARRSRAAKDAEVARAAARLAEEKRLAAEAGVREAEEAAREQALTDAIRAEREALLARRDRLQPLEAWITRALEAENTSRSESAQKTSRRALARQEEEAARAEEEQAKRLLIQHAEASQALQQARARQDLASHRAALRSGEPCPLCGATEHPYATGEAALAGLVGELEARVKALQEALLAARSAATAHRTQAAAHEEQAGEAAVRARRAREELGQAREQWARAARELGLEAPAPDDHGRGVLRAEAAAIGARLDAIKALEGRAKKLADKAGRRREDAEARRADEARAQKALGAAEKAVADVARLEEKHTSELERAREMLEQAARELAGPMAGGRPEWRSEIAADARAFEAICRSAVGQHQGRAAERQEIAIRLEELAPRRGAAAALVKERSAHAHQQAREHAGKVEALAALQTRRGALLDGRPTDEVRGALAAQVAERRTALEEARTAEQDVGKQAASAEVAARMAARAAEERARDGQRAAEDLAAKLAEEGIDRGAVEAHLARGAGWIEETREQLAKAKQAAETARAMREDRARAGAEHEASGPPAVTEEEAAAQREEAAAEQERLSREHAREQAKLLNDDQARVEQAGKIQRLEERRAVARRWGEMDELIGSSDGKKFRIFAQSLTLDALLSHANEHLEELAPRYHLMRVPGHDLDLQILDRDMADEIRSVNSLSGGESFLVSLALALGLSSLSARDVRVETLFIDEGLSALDPKALDATIAALEVLQASGRQVGLISHVAALAEQIGTEVRLVPLGGGRSRVVVEGASDPGQVPAAAAPGISAPKGRTRKKAGGETRCP